MEKQKRHFQALECLPRVAESPGFSAHPYVTLDEAVLAFNPRDQGANVEFKVTLNSVTCSRPVKATGDCLKMGRGQGDGSVHAIKLHRLKSTPGSQLEEKENLLSRTVPWLPRECVLRSGRLLLRMRLEQ